MHRRLLAVAAAAALSVSGLLMAASADAVTAPCSGSVCVETLAAASHGDLNRGEGDTAGWTIKVDTGQANLSLTVSQTADLLARPHTATFDGNPLPASAMTINGRNVTVDLTSVNPVAAGQHEISYGVTMGPAATDDQTATAAVTFDDTMGGAPATSNAEPEAFPLSKPDFNLQSLEPPFGPITAGNVFGFSVFAYGPSGVPATLDIDVPRGFAFVEADQGNDQPTLHCPAVGRTVRCTGVRYNSADLVGIELRPNRDDAVGTHGTITVTIHPDGVPDATPADNTRQLNVAVVGTVALKLAVTSPFGVRKDGKFVESTFLPIGKPTVLTMTVTNQGPNAATGVLARFAMETNTADYFTLGFGRGITGQQSQNHQFGYGIWRIGSIGVAQTAVTTLTVTPKRFGDRATLLVNMQSNELNTLQCDSRACLGSGGIGIEVVKAAAVTPTPTPTSAPPVASSATDPQLANTGTSAETSLFAGVIAVLAGLGFVLLGRRRRSLGAVQPFGR